LLIWRNQEKRTRIEACSTAHYWAREIRELGHEVRLMPPSYVAPYVKRGKTDAADAAAICEAVTRLTMRFVPIKTAEPRIVWALLVRGEAYRMPAAIFAIPGASIRSRPPTPSPGMMIATGGQLRGPLALVLAPIGDLITSNGDAKNPDANHPAKSSN
jgi:hypothetical protein